MLFEEVATVCDGWNNGYLLSNSFGCSFLMDVIFLYCQELSGIPSNLWLCHESCDVGIERYYFILGLITCKSCEINVNFNVIIIPIDRSAIPLAWMFWN